MRKLLLNPVACKRIARGEKLLQIEDFVNSDILEVDEGETICLIDNRKRFRAYALVGKQNKGLAWVYSTDPHELWSPEFIYWSLEQALQLRENLFKSSTTTAFRLFNGEGDGIGGVTLDWYDGFVQINWYSLGIFQYRQWIIDALVEQLKALKGIYETKRFPINESQLPIEHTYGEEAARPIVIKENGVNFAIHLGQEWMTGLFLDQRKVRQFVKEQAKDTTVLNLFSYTGGFSVAAFCGGASKTVSVDVANRSLDKTREQFELNKIDNNLINQEIRVMDVFDYVQYAKRHQLSFDIVVCDPPSFARTKKYKFSANKNYGKLATDILRLTKVGGLCILSTNHAGYSKEIFQKDIMKAIGQAGMQAQIIQSFGLSEDFPTSADKLSQYLKVLVLYRQQ